MKNTLTFTESEKQEMRQSLRAAMFGTKPTINWPDVGRVMLGVLEELVNTIESDSFAEMKLKTFIKKELYIALENAHRIIGKARGE